MLERTTAIGGSCVSAKTPAYRPPCMRIYYRPMKCQDSFPCYFSWILFGIPGILWYRISLYYSLGDTSGNSVRELQHQVKGGAFPHQRWELGPQSGETPCFVVSSSQRWAMLKIHVNFNFFTSVSRCKKYRFRTWIVHVALHFPPTFLSTIQLFIAFNCGRQVTTFFRGYWKNSSWEPVGH